jgi:hypothetical protein
MLVNLTVPIFALPEVALSGAERGLRVKSNASQMAHRNSLFEGGRIEAKISFPDSPEIRFNSENQCRGNGEIYGGTDIFGY